MVIVNTALILPSTTPKPRRFPTHCASSRRRGHPDSCACDALLRWSPYARQAREGLAVCQIRVPRVRCKVCGRTHSLPPDVLLPFRHYVVLCLQEAVFLYPWSG